MLRLFRYLKGHWGESIIAPLFKLLEACFELTVPIIMADMIDTGIKNADPSYVLRSGAWIVGMGLFGFICAVTAQYFAARASMAFGTVLRNDLYKRIGSFSSEDIDRFGTATLMTRLTADVLNVQGCVNMTIRLLMRSPFIVFGAVISAFMIDTKLALIFAVTVPILSAAVYVIMKNLLPVYAKMRTGIDVLTRHTRENLTGARVVRAFAAQKTEREEFNADADALYGTQMNSVKISALLAPISYSIVNIATAVLLWCGALSVNVGDITQGQAVALINYMTQILIALIALANYIVTVTKSASAAARINEILDVVPTAGYGDQTLENVETIEFSSVGYSFPNASAPALKNISFSAKKGMTVGIIGATGSGKSTLAALITRERDAKNGTIRINGEEIRSFTCDSLRRCFAVVPQKAELFSGTVRENLLWRDENASDDELFRTLETAQASDFIGKDLDRKVEKGGTNFSGGQKQRLTVARALVGKSDVLILDDSASALDFATDAKLRKAIRSLEGERIVFIISQRVFAVKNADLILVLDSGELAGAGTHDELLKSCPVYGEICRSQLSDDSAAEGTK